MTRHAAGTVSILEVIAAAVILVILADLSMPVFVKARESAMKSRSEQKLKDLARAIELYRSDHGDSGGPSGIGLPLDDVFPEAYGLKVPECYLSGGHPRLYGGKEPSPAMYRRLFPTPFELEAALRYVGKEGVAHHLRLWGEHVWATGGTVVLYMDDTWMPQKQAQSTLFPKPVFAVFTDGHIGRKTIRGEMPAKQFTIWNP